MPSRICLRHPAVAKLDHPGIVPVYDVGSSEEYPCFIVSKYIDGQDLAAACAIADTYH